MTKPVNPPVDSHQPWSGVGRGPGMSKAFKTAVVRALRAGLAADPLVGEDPILARAQVHLEYPVKAVQYPAVWVTAQFRNVQWSDMAAGTDGGSMRGQFEATVNLEVMALTNEERDTLADAVLNMVMFAPVQTESNIFGRALINDDMVAVTLLHAAPTVGAEAMQVGTPWDPQALAYTRQVGFNAVGEFYARVGDPQLIPLRLIAGRVDGQLSGTAWEGTLAPGDIQGEGW